MGRIWRQQLADMKRDTALTVENKLSEVVAHLRSTEGSSSHPVSVRIGDVTELISAVQYRVLHDMAGQAMPSALGAAREASESASNPALNGQFLNGVIRAPLAGCLVVQAHSFKIAANNNIVPWTQVDGMRTYDDSVLEEGHAVARKATEEYAEQMKLANKKPDERTAKPSGPAPETENRRQLDSARRLRGGTPFPQPVQSVRHTPNLLLVPALAKLNVKGVGEQDWYNYYSALLNTSLQNSTVPAACLPSSLKGTVVISPQPDREGKTFSPENLRGLVRICLHRSSVAFSRRTGTNLLAITIAHPDEDVCAAIRDILAEAAAPA
jgi:hypothetical protein